MKKIVYSSLQPTGNLTIGNYLGALRDFKKLEDKGYDCFYSVANLHSLTTLKNKEELKKNTLEVFAILLSLGLEKSKIFIQGDIKEHTELYWILNSISYLGEMKRMHQFKEKWKNNEDSNIALLSYPILMAADILLYDTDIIPVGKDQIQHINFAKDLANRFNNTISPFFKIPEGLEREPIKIMDLQNPEIKMSKSSRNKKSILYLLDNDEDIENKIIKAKTDSLSYFSYEEERSGLKNLIDIFSLITDNSIEDIINKYRNRSFKDFKIDLADILVKEIKPIREKYKEISQDKNFLLQVREKNTKEISLIARDRIDKIKKEVGFLGF